MLVFCTSHVPVMWSGYHNHPTTCFITTQWFINSVYLWFYVTTFLTYLNIHIFLLQKIETYRETGTCISL